MNAINRTLRRLFNQRVEQNQTARKTLSSLFGPLELAVLEALWSRSESLSVKALQKDFPDVAYTTLMTTLDRLYKKRALTRSKRGRAFFYEARMSREEVQSSLASVVFTALLGGDVGVRLVLSSFVDAVSQRDDLLLNDLESLVRQRRTESGQK
jgi:predicted transcriptional regulator